MTCGKFPDYFITSFCVIDDVQQTGGSVTGTRPFKLWPAQFTMLDALLAHRFLIVLKARQLGESWVACAYILWQCLFQARRVWMIFSIGQVEANEMIARIHKLYERLPPWLKHQCPKLTTDITAEMEWDNGSQVRALPATQNAGSSFTASGVLMDEFAKMMFAQQVYTAAKPTVDNGGQLIIISTFKWQTGRPFHQLWHAAKQGINGFVPLFFSWRARPDRPPDFQQAMIAAAVDPADAMAEYPDNENEAFVAGGNVRFLDAWIQAQQKNICAPLVDGSKTPHLLPSLGITDPGFLRGLSIYRLPEIGHTYVVGVDSSEGLPHSDYSPIVILDSFTWEEVACCYGKFHPEDLACYAAALGHFYYCARLNVLRKNHGHVVLLKLVEACYPNLANGPDGRHGWDENVKTNKQLEDSLAEALRDDAVQVHTQLALSEMQMFQKLDNGSCKAPPGLHDDFVKAWMAAVILVRQPGNSNCTVYEMPQASANPQPAGALPAPGYESNTLPGWGSFGGFGLPAGLTGWRGRR